MRQQEGQTTRKSGESEEVETETEAEALDPRAQREFEKLITKINSLVAEMGTRLDTIANLVFTYCFGKDAGSALDPNTTASRPLLSMLNAAGGELHLDAPTLRKYLRIGALNHKLSDGKWSELPPSIKLELLPLLGADLNYERLEAGVRYAIKEEVTVRQLRAWVANRLETSASEEPGMKPRPPSFVAGNNAVEVGVRFARVADRRRWLDKLARLPKEDRQQHLVRVKAAARNFEKLAQELEAMVNED